MKNKMDEMMQMMDDKKSVKMSEKDVQAKKDILKELLAECDAELQGRAKRGLDSVKGMKVSVMAENPKDLKEGLETAEELTEEMSEEPTEEATQEAAEEMSAESKEEEQEEKVLSLEDMMKNDDEEEGLFQRKRNKNS
jgi:hypothetical protein